MREHEHHMLFCESVKDGILFFEERETRHAVSVLRVHMGDTISATDGKGEIFEAVVESFDRNAMTARISSRRTLPAPVRRVNLCIGLCEKDSFESAAAFVTPLGAYAVTPIVCRRCQEKWWEKSWEKHCERITRIMITGTKQCLNARIPILNPPIAFEKAVSSSKGLIIFGDATGNRLLELSSELSAAEDISCFTGPPGGFDEDEINRLKLSGARSFSLGSFRLRTEHAAAAAMAVLGQII
jgi:16S rRNA (uracil1498-N3)-methyltransferase